MSLLYNARTPLDLTRRAVTVIVDLANEDAFFEALHKTWVVSKSYPDVSPVVDAEEFP